VITAWPILVGSHFYETHPTFIGSKEKPIAQFTLTVWPRPCFAPRHAADIGSLFFAVLRALAGGKHLRLKRSCCVFLDHV
jgi:hypothetical protein